MQEATVRALGEALERFAAEPRDRIRVHTARARDLDRRFIAPETLAPERTEDEQPIEWVAGFGIQAHDPVWIPANAVFFPYLGTPQLWSANTTGLAAGSTVTEAVCAGLLECIERDALTRALLWVAADAADRIPGVDPACLSRFDFPNGVGLRAWWLTHDIAVPAVLAVVTESMPDGGEFAHLGCVAHPSARVALEDAVFEAAQSRVVDIQGAREDLPPFDPEQRIAPWFDRAPASIASLPEGTDTEDVADDVRLILGALRAAGVAAPVAVDLSLDGIDAAVVRVIAPGLEHGATNPERVGARALRWLNEAKP